MSRAMPGVGLDVGVASHLISRPPMSDGAARPIAPTKCLLLFIEDSA